MGKKARKYIPVILLASPRLSHFGSFFRHRKCSSVYLRCRRYFSPNLCYRHLQIYQTVLMWSKLARCERDCENQKETTEVAEQNHEQKKPAAAPDDDITGGIPNENLSIIIRSSAKGGLGREWERGERQNERRKSKREWYAEVPTNTFKKQLRIFR